MAAARGWICNSGAKDGGFGVRRRRAASPTRDVPAPAMSSSHLSVMRIQGTSQTKCHTKGLAIMSKQDEQARGWARGLGTVTFCMGGHTMPSADGQGAAAPRGGSAAKGGRHGQHHRGTSQRCQGADTVPTQGPRAGQQLAGGFPSSCPSSRLASHPELGCKRLSCDRRLPVRSRLGAGAAGRVGSGRAGPGRARRCRTLSARHRPQRHAAPQAFQRRGQGAGTQEGGCWFPLHRRCPGTSRDVRAWGAAEC